jgi:hypothetical protein
MAYRKIDRRDVLRSAALTFLLAPVMRATMAKAAPSNAQRLLVLFTPNGLNYKDAGPSGTETDFALGDYFKPIERHKADLVAFSGMHIGGVPFGENSEYGHRSGGMGCLTCTPDLKTGRATGPSVDQLIARKLNEQGKAPYLRAPVFSVGASGVSGYAHSFYEAAGKPVALQNDPKLAYDSLFAGITAGMGQDPAKIFAKKKSILDVAYADCQSYLPALPTDGRALLDYHCQRIRDLETNLQNGLAATCTPPKEALDPVATLNKSDPRSYPALTDFFWKLIEVALLCDLTRVISFSFGETASRFNMPWLTVPTLATVDTGEMNVKDHHSHTHAGTRETIGLFMNWYSTKISELFDRLRAPQPGGGRLLDTTLAYWTTEYGSGGPHRNADVAMFTLGSAGGRIKTGRHLTAKNDAKQTHALFVSMIQAMGVEGVNQFGHPMGGSGPLAALAG